jgi:hypothetical protein
MTDPDIARFCRDLDTWMSQAVESGDYPSLGTELITAWTMFLDRYDPTDEDGSWSWTVLHPVDQSVALSVGHGHLIAHIKSILE